MKTKHVMILLLALAGSAGCATPVTPTNYLFHHRIAAKEAVKGKPLNVFWTNNTVSLSLYKHILVKQFTASDPVGITPEIDSSKFCAKLRKMIMADLRNKDRKAVTNPKNIPTGIPYLVVEGNLAQINPGNKALRGWFPFGPGRVMAEAEIKISRMDSGRKMLCGELTATESAFFGLWGGKDGELLEKCLDNISGSVSDFLVSHRNYQSAFNKN